MYARSSGAYRMAHGKPGVCLMDEVGLVKWVFMCFNRYQCSFYLHLEPSISTVRVTKSVLAAKIHLS